MDPGEKVSNVVLDELGLETSGSVWTTSSVELVLSHVAMGRDAERAPSQDLTVL